MRFESHELFFVALGKVNGLYIKKKLSMQTNWKPKFSALLDRDSAKYAKKKTGAKSDRPVFKSRSRSKFFETKLY